MQSVPLEEVLSHVTALTKMTPRARGYGVKGSGNTVFWPSYDNYRLGILVGMVYGDGNLIRRNEGVRTGKWRIEFCEGDAPLVMRLTAAAESPTNISHLPASILTGKKLESFAFPRLQSGVELQCVASCVGCSL